MGDIVWMRNRLEQAARLGEVVKLTGPRSVSDPGASRDCTHGRQWFCLPCVEAGAWTP